MTDRKNANSGSGATAIPLNCDGLVSSAGLYINGSGRGLTPSIPAQRALLA